MFAVIIIIDILDNLRVVIILDMKRYLQFDFYYISHEYGQDYSYWAKIDAYRLNNIYKPSICGICQSEFSEDVQNTRKQLLKCGHLYHKNCIQNFEESQWNTGHGSLIQSYQMYCQCTNCKLNGEQHWLYPYCACALCKTRYHSNFTKFDYDENFWDKQGILTSFWHRPLGWYFTEMIWCRRQKEYIKWVSHIRNNTDWYNSWRLKFYHMSKI
eukprot:242206_1